MQVYATRWMLGLALCAAGNTAPPRAAAEETVPDVAGVVRKLERANLGRANAHEYVFFDVDWSFSEEVAKRSRITGTVTLYDAGGRARLKLPWPLARSPALGRHYSEKGVGLALEDAGKAAEWIAGASAADVTIRYTRTEK